MGAGVCAVLGFVLVVIADIGNGPGDLETNTPGWPGVVQTVSGLLFIAAIVLGIWAAVRNHGLKSDGGLASAVGEGARLWSELDRTLAREWVDPLVARVLGARLHRDYTSVLRADDVTRFAGTSAEVVRTSAQELVEELITGSHGAAIGLCGPRGVGKTTLIRETCGSGTAAGRTIGICVDVPAARRGRTDRARRISRQSRREAAEMVALGQGSLPRTRLGDTGRDGRRAEYELLA